MKKNNWKILIPILLIAFFLRLLGIFYHSYGDETNQLYRTLLMAQFKFEQNWNHGIYSYFMVVYYALFFLVMKIAGVFQSLADFKEYYFTDAHWIFVAGRVAECLAGTACVGALYLLGRKLYNNAVGLIAAIFLSFAYVHVEISQIARGQAFCCLLVILALYFIYLINSTRKLSNYLWAGALIGAAVSIRLYTIVLLVPLLLSHFFPSSSSQVAAPFKVRHLRKKGLSDMALSGLKDGVLSKKIFYALFVCLGVFIVCNPDIFLNFREMTEFIFKPLNMLNEKDVITAVGYTTRASNGWIYYLSLGLPQALGWELYIISILGFVYGIFKIRNIPNLIMLSFVSIFILAMGKSSITAPHYLFPIIPALVILGSNFIVSIVDHMRTKKKVTVLVFITLVLILNPARRIISNDIGKLKTTTLDLSREWIFQNIPDGSRVAVESTGHSGPDIKLDRVLYYDIYNLPEKELKELYNERQKQDPGSSSAIKHFIENPPEPKYYIINLGVRENISIKYLKDKKPEYVVISSGVYNLYNDKETIERYPDLARSRLEMYAWIEKEWDLLKVFTSTNHHPGPQIKIYERRKN